MSFLLITLNAFGMAVEEITDARVELEKNPYALHEACRKGNLEKVILLISAGASLTTKQKRNNRSSGHTPIHWAIIGGNKKIVELLISTEATLVNICNNSDETPLHYASLFKQEEILDVLLCHGAQVNAQNTIGNTPLHTSAANGYKNIVTSLLYHNASLLIKNKSDEIPMNFAIKNGWYEIVKLFLTNYYFQSQKKTAPKMSSNLQEQCLQKLLASLDHYKQESHNTLISNLTDHLLITQKQITTFIHYAPFEIQQRIFNTWQQKESPENKNKVTFFLQEHAQLHLHSVQQMLLIKNKQNISVCDTRNSHSLLFSITGEETPYDRMIQEKIKKIIPLLAQFSDAQEFSNLDRNLQQMIFNAIKKKFSNVSL